MLDSNAGMQLWRKYLCKSLYKSESPKNDDLQHQKQHPSEKKLSHRMNSKNLPCTLLLRSMLRSRHMALHKTFRLELLDPSICPCFRLVSIVVLIENCTNEFVIANSFRFAVIETCFRWRHAKHPM